MGKWSRRDQEPYPRQHNRFGPRACPFLTVMREDFLEEEEGLCTGLSGCWVWGGLNLLRREQETGDAVWRGLVRGSELHC